MSRALNPSNNSLYLFLFPFYSQNFPPEVEKKENEEEEEDKMEEEEEENEDERTKKVKCSSRKGSSRKSGRDSVEKKEPVMPISDRPTRERKVVKRYSAPSVEFYLQVGAFSVLKELVVVLPDYLADHIGTFIPGIEKALNNKSSTSNLKIEALIFTRLVLASHSPSIFHPYVKDIPSPVLSAVSEHYYKVTAEALIVCGELVRVVCPNLEGFGFNFKPYVHPIYNAIMSRLTNQDQDQRTSLSYIYRHCNTLASSKLEPTLCCILFLLIF
ncbi:hypothetical protein ES288_A02G152100v1 [Gossypium darwinii]|uniref:Uncharacterized protein n=1 Tax=Gossypium darwinii TaxID=34276 RepID=A0A5D2HE81_GOSDA|nr:hypothetical protein ES288_A02G152100v1 [Gossypium darwinii]